MRPGPCRHSPVRDACPRHNGKGAENEHQSSRHHRAGVGVILVDTGAGRQNVVANWGDRDGLPYFMPYYAETSDPFPFLFMDVADIHVDRPLVHKGRLRDEVAHDGFDDWNPMDDDLDSDEPCDVYPLTNGWTVVAPKNWN